MLSGRIPASADRGASSRRKRPLDARGPACRCSRPRTPRSLAGATILQIVPALRDDPAAHAAVDIALHACCRAGARAIVAGDGGPLVGELRAFGGEWMPMTSDIVNPLALRANATIARATDRRRARRHRACAERRGRLERAVGHAQAAGVPGHLVSATGCRKPAGRRRSLAARSRAATASSRRRAYISLSMIERYRHSSPTASPSFRAHRHRRRSIPAAISGDRIAALRRVWGILPDMRVVSSPAGSRLGTDR